MFDAILPLGEFDRDVLRPGMGITVSIETEVLADRLTVPLEAVGVSADGAFVQVQSGKDAERRTVVLGERDRDRVVVESGLEAGDVVLLNAGGRS